MSEIKLIVFDLGGTVFSKGKQAFINLLMNKLGIDREHIVNAVDGPHAIEYRRNMISRKEYWNQVKNKLNVSIELEDLEKLWFDQYEPLPGMPEILKELRTQYTVAYLSNNTPERVSYLNEKYHFLNWFDGGLFSYETQSVKTDGKIYTLLLEKFKDIQPEQTVIIDDLEENLKDPSRIGFVTINFKHPNQLKKSLSEKGILN